MSSHSPHRSRKSQMYTTLQTSSQNSPPREMSPSPHNRQRTVKAQSMPIVPSVMQVFNTAGQRQVQQSPPSANVSLQSRRSTTPPLSSKLPLPREDIQEHYTPPMQPIMPPQQPPPPPPHSHSQPNIHSHVPMNPTMGYPRPINRIAPPFLASFHAMEENWQMTDELMAEIERADYAQTLSQHPAAPGTSGVAYAGGAQSGAVYIREAPSPHKDSVLDRVRAAEHPLPLTKDADSPQAIPGPPPRRPPRVNDRDRERDPQPTDSIQPRNRPLPASPGNSPSYSPQGHPQARGHSPDRLSPPYHTPQGSSGESGTAGDYVSLKRESYQSSTGPHARIPTPPTARRSSNATSENTRATPPAVSKLASQTPPLQAMKTRTPDKSLPVQEEPEDDVAASLKDDTSHLQYEHGGNPPHDDDDDTLIETETAYIRPGNDSDHDGDSASYTPRSPSVTLPDTYPPRHYVSSHPNNRLASLTKHHRNGSTDQLGLRSFDAVVSSKPQVRPSEESRESATVPVRVNAEQTYGTSEETVIRQQTRSFSDNRDDRNHRDAERFPNLSPNQQNIRPHPLQTQVHREDYYDDPASAYLQMYFQSTRPNAPIPPTPHSQTAAPSPSPFISSIQPSPAPPVGSPYPYPFTHVHRNPYPVHAVPAGPSSNYDPNHPSVIEEQLALQMQMYALNNNAALSDSTFSPSATPFPGAGYNPWAFLQASRAFGGRRFDSMSLQSSPSHQPVSLPFSTSRGRGIKRREKSSNLRTPGSGTKQKAVKPPPRVESTQPRDTSPEPYSSGEETAGEGYEVHEEAAWVNGDGEDGEWVDEEGDKDELLDLEYHPSFISNMEKRRRKWDARWEALQQAFQALDCETDTTMVLLAAPSHSTKLHALTSRSVRRDQLIKSPAMVQIRTVFKGIASRRQATRSRTASASILQRLMSSSNVSGGDGSDTSSSEARETELKRALEATLGSLESLRAIYEHRVSRWEDEMSRISDERDKVELLLRQTIGMGLQPNGMQPGM